MGAHPLAGKPAPPELLIDVARLEHEYYQRHPDPGDAAQLVSFGTSGHRGSPFDGTFNQDHILAVTQAICEYRRAQGIDGPLYLGKCTHAASGPAERTALEVLAANGVETFFQRDGGFTPTPAISHAILVHNRGRAAHLADGIVVTPSHNPPGDGGFKYNPPHGGPADSGVTSWIQDRANALLRSGVGAIARAASGPTLHAHDFAEPYVHELASAIDLPLIRAAGLKIGADPLGGAAVGYWGLIGERYGLEISVVNPRVDATFAFMTVDHDGKIRMDCSSPNAMAGLVKLKDSFDIAFGNDTDADRHGIVTPTGGLMNPNHYLAAAIDYLISSRGRWPASAAIGKTLVSSSLIDRVVARHGRPLLEVPVGFKWFAPGLHDGTVGFAGEESAGASFLRSDGSVWTTDKDGPLLCLLAAEMTARDGRNPEQRYRRLAEELGTPYYTRRDAPATLAQKVALARLTPESLSAGELAGEPITAKLTRAPGNNAAFGGLKVITDGGWFAARPSGTESVYKLYAESFRSAAHLEAIVSQAQQLLDGVL